MSSVLDNVRVERVSSKFGFDIGNAWDSIVAEMRRAFGAEAWKWFNANQETVIFTVHKWFISYDVKVKDCRWLFVELFGPAPAEP